VIGGIQATLDMAGAWEANRLGRAPFQVRGSHVRFGPPGIEKNRIADCSGAAWLAMYRRLRVDLRQLVSTAYTVCVFAPESSDAFEVLLVHDFPEWIEHFLLVSRTKTGASLSMGYRRPQPADLDESFLAAVARTQVELSMEEQLNRKVDRLLANFHDSGASTVLHCASSDEDRRTTFRSARWEIEARLGTAAGSVLRPGGRVVWWRRGTGSTALWEEGSGAYATLHITCWEKGAPPILSPAPKRRWFWFGPRPDR
jgi:hypothetical protein